MHGDLSPSWKMQRMGSALARRAAPSRCHQPRPGFAAGAAGSPAPPCAQPPGPASSPAPSVFFPETKSVSSRSRSSGWLQLLPCRAGLGMHRMLGDQLPRQVAVMESRRPPFPLPRTKHYGSPRKACSPFPSSKSKAQDSSVLLRSTR